MGSTAFILSVSLFLYAFSRKQYKWASVFSFIAGMTCTLLLIEIVRLFK